MNNTGTFTLANTQILDSNWPKALLKTSPLSQIVNAKYELSDSKSVAKLEGDFELDKEADLFSGMLASDTNQNQRQ